MFGAPGAGLTLGQQARASAAGVGIFAVGVQQIFWRLAAIEFAQQNRGGSFDHGVGRVVQGVREADVGGVLAQTNGMSEIRVGMKLDDKGGRPALASEARVDALKKNVAAGNRFADAAQGHEGFLRTGAGVRSLAALSASAMASLVPSMASCRVSL